jgi:hypothetical protein
MESPVADRAKDLPDLTDGLAGAAQRDSLHAQLIGLPEFARVHSGHRRFAVMTPCDQPLISRYNSLLLATDTRRQP